MGLLQQVTVAVEGTVFHFDKPYSYLWPDTLPMAKPGLRVMVPFGGGNRTRQGVVMTVEASEEQQKLKSVQSVLDEEPLFTEEMLRLAIWMKEHTFCTLFDALRAMLPPGLMMRIRPVYRLKEGDFPNLTEEENQVTELLEAIPEGMDRKTLLESLGLADDSTVLESMHKKGMLTLSAEAVRVAGDATTRMVRPSDEADELDVDCLSEKQSRVFELIQTVGCASVKEICYFCSVTSSVVTTLEKKGFVVVYDQEVLRSPKQIKDVMPELQSTPLNEEQQKAYEGLLRLVDAGKPDTALLYGVTGSGKTQVYMNLIDEVLRQGHQALVLVPEISLTPQLLELFVSRYGKRVAVTHSGLSLGERMDEWKRIRRGEATVVVGTRSAVFAPLSDIGLIIFDEEQEHTYKSETTPRYHAKDVAKFRCKEHNALLLLASATPALESYNLAVSGKYHLFSLSTRYGKAQLPKVKVVDLREEDGDCVIGNTLQTEMEACLERGKQVILLLNRRGYNTFVSCRSCGHAITCPSCSISMTYHSANGKLICHYCGHMENPVQVCPACGSDKIRYTGLGTQKVEDELHRLFPDEPILRMDADTTMSKYAYEKKFRAFREKEYRIMIGTQMVAKGLDFPDVGLVGILSADQSLYGDDFRCYETSFDLFTQVIGRAGRRDDDSMAIIQTYTPDNEVITYAAEQNYAAFYEEEIESRRIMKYPPYSDLCQFGFIGKDKREVETACRKFLENLKKKTTEAGNVPVIALKPSPAFVSKVSGKYRYKLLIKTKNRAGTRSVIRELLSDFGKDTTNKGVSVFVDMNPVSML